MQGWIAVSRWACAAGLGVVLAACGGGGGGGDGGAGNGGTTGNTEGAVQLRLASPAKLSDKLYEGSRKVRVNPLSIAVSGNVQVLAGRTLYAIIEVADPLFEATPMVSLGETSAAVVLTGRTDVPKGHYTGTARIYACLDAACATQLAGSPMSLPYDVEVISGFALSQDNVTFRGPFGTQVPPVEVSFLNLPPNPDVTFSDLWLGSTPVTANRTAPDKVLITPVNGTVPGTYTKTTTLNTFLVDPSFPNENVAFHKTLTVQYTVDPIGSPYYLSPSSATYTFSLADAASRSAAQQQGSFSFGVQDPASTWNSLGTRYDSAPPAAAGHPEVNDWLVRGGGLWNQYSVGPCGWTTTPNCLPVGTYQASFPFEVTPPGGVTTQGAFTVTMTITP